MDIELGVEMSTNLYFIELMAREKQKQIEREAQRLHHVAMARHSEPGVVSRLAIAIGNLLITAGTFLQKRYRPVCGK